MRSQKPALSRLSGSPQADGDNPDDGAPDGDDGQDPPVPSWVPDGRPRHGSEWLAVIRADPGRAGGVALAAIAVLAILITVFTLLRSNPAPVVSAKLPPVQAVSGTSTAPATAALAAQPVVVSVVGLVNQPGLVTVAPQARVADAVQAAGGPLTGADTLGLNLARRVADGEQIVVGIATPAGRLPALGSSAGQGPATPAAAAPASAAATEGGGTEAAAPLDLNSASAEQLDALPGVGPVTVAAILAWRQANGRFASVDQLAEVDGIGPARLEKLRPLVRV